MKTMAELTEQFLAGQYGGVAAELHTLRPDLSDEDMAIEMALAAVKVLSEYYAALRTAVEKAADKIDATLLADPSPLAAYADARDILRGALKAAPEESAK